MKKTKLTLLCSPKQWKTIPTKDLINDGYPVYGANGVIGYYDEYNHSTDTIIIGCRGSCGNVNIARGKSYINGNAMCLDELSSEVDLQYLYYFLQNYDFRSVISGTTIPQVTKQGLEKIDVLVLPMVQQKQIVRKLQLLDSVIEDRRTELGYFDTLIKSRFIEMFGDPITNEKNWSMYPLESVCKTIVDCPHSTPNYIAEDTGYMCIRTSIVKKNRILWDEIEYISHEEYIQRIQRKRPEKGDVVYTREGAILGIAAMIDRDCNVALGQRSMLLSPNTDKCLPQFLSVAMNFESFLKKALGGVSGSASPHINVGDIKTFTIILPPIELQKQFTAFIEQIDKSKFEIQQSLEKLEILKKSLMQQYFG